jgi:cytochrome c556
MKPKFRDVSPPAVLVALVLATGLATGAWGGDDSPTQKIMDQIHARNRAIGKGLRAPTALEAADRTGLAAHAASLVQLGKEARGLTEPAKERKKSQQDWTRAADDFVRAADDFARVIANPGTSRPQVTQSYQKLQKTCLNCHSAFR